MSVLTMPFNADRFHYDASVELEGTFFRFVIHYNDLQTSWFMDILADDETPLVMGQRLALSSDLLAAFKHLAIPPGRFVMHDTQGGDVEADQENFGDRVLLLYVESE